MNASKSLSLAEIMEKLGLDIKLNTEDVIAMVVTKRQEILQTEKDMLSAKINEIEETTNDSAFNKQVKVTIENFIKENKMPAHNVESYRSDYRNGKAELILSLSFDLPTVDLAEIMKLRKEKEPELNKLNRELRILTEESNNVRKMERETRAQLTELKLRAMGQDALIERLVLPK